MSKNRSEKIGKVEIEDVVKCLIQWIVVSGLAFLYWMTVLLLASLFLLNVWHTSFEAILRYSIVLTVVTSIVYGIVIIRRKLR